MWLNNRLRKMTKGRTFSSSSSLFSCLRKTFLDLGKYNKKKYFSEQINICSKIWVRFYSISNAAISLYYRTNFGVNLAYVILQVV